MGRIATKIGLGYHTARGSIGRNVTWNYCNSKLQTLKQRWSTFCDPVKRSGWNFDLYPAMVTALINVNYEIWDAFLISDSLKDKHEWHRNHSMQYYSLMIRTSTGRVATGRYRTIAAVALQDSEKMVLHEIRMLQGKLITV